MTVEKSPIENKVKDLASMAAVLIVSSLVWGLLCYYLAYRVLGFKIENQQSILAVLVFFYPLALFATWRASARYHSSHATGQAQGLTLGLNLVKDIFIRESQHIRTLERNSDARLREKAMGLMQEQSQVPQLEPGFEIVDGDYTLDPFEDALEL